MIWVRLIILTACLTTTGWYLEREQREGRLQRVDDLFLDFLAANAREQLTRPVEEKDSPVTFVTLKEEERGEYSAWPPAPLDWQILFKGLQAFEPSVLVIPEPLFWGTPSPDFVPAVAEAMLPFTSIVLGVETKLAEGDLTAPAFMGGLEDQLPRFLRIDGDTSLVPAFSALITAPDAALRAQSEIALSTAISQDKKNALPYALRESSGLMPAVLAQTLARYTGTPYALHRLRLGPGAAAYLGDGLFVPLENNATILSDPAPSVPTVNALDLMTGTLADGLGEAGRKALGKGRIIVIGTDSGTPGQPPSLARMHAQALTRVLSLPRLQKLAQMPEWITWGIAAAVACWLVLVVQRGRVLLAGASCLFAALLLSYLAFQSSLLWCPPALPMSLITVGMLVGVVLGRTQSAEKEIATP